MPWDRKGSRVASVKAASAPTGHPKDSRPSRKMPHTSAPKASIATASIAVYPPSSPSSESGAPTASTRGCGVGASVTS